MDISTNELEWITKHLGHSVNIHKNYYQVMCSTIEKAKIAKLLILADRGEVAKYSGKTLDEIEIDKAEDKDGGDKEDEEGHDGHDGIGIPITKGTVEKTSGRRGKRQAGCDDSDEENRDISKGGKARKFAWGEENTATCEELFQDFLIKNRLPGKKEIIRIKSSSVLEPIPWGKVKDKLNSLLQKKKRSSWR